MRDIFLSYARVDIERVRPLVHHLEEAGWSVWWDQKIPAGSQWDQVIERALAQTRAVIVVWTKDSVDSRWVRTEAREGLERDILIPIRLDPVQLPLEFRSTHTVDFTSWGPGQDVDGHVGPVLSSLHELLGGPAPVGAAAPVGPDPTTGHSISGVVANALHPSEKREDAGLPGVVLDLHAIPDGKLIATTATDSSGAYRFEGIQAGTYAVRAVSPAGAVVMRRLRENGWIENVAFVGVSASVPRVGTVDPERLPAWDHDSDEAEWLGPADFSCLAHACTVRGLVTLDGDAFPGANVELRRRSAVQPSLHIGKVTTDSSGQFAFVGILEGLYQLTAQGPEELESRSVKTCLVRRDIPDAEVTVTLTRSGA